VGSRPRYRFGFDIGGTFTDFVLLEVGAGRLFSHKVLTTPSAPAQAVLHGWRDLLAQVGARPEQIEAAVHGTTLITNALIERRGARTALLTTAGFRDILEIRREMRYDIYDLLMELPAPLAPRPLRLGIRERINARGEVVTPLAADDVTAARRTLAAAAVEAVAVCYLHAYQNPAHERATAAALREALPGVRLSLSSEVAPEIREYERMSTTVCNAYVQPLSEAYLDDLLRRLRAAGYTRELYLMLSSGGITTVGTAARFPIRLVESGPAAGVLAAMFHGERLGIRDLLSFDMGGTTAKACLIKDGQPAMTRQFEIARAHRFKRGSGLPVQVPSIELIEIGAGGGSIAWIDDLELLKVGPQSAGADPGPACYGFGGTAPTVTDADLLLGYLNPDYFLGGRMSLDRAASERAMRAIAGRLGVDVAGAAAAIHQVVDESMVAATRVHVAERGGDARRLWLLAFGGAGPVHAHAIADALAMPGYICPPGAGVTSALGFLVAPASFEFSRSVAAAVTADVLPRLDAIFSELEADGRATLAEAGVRTRDMRFVRQAEMRHAGQGHEILVDLGTRRLASRDVDADVKPMFYRTYEDRYGHAHRHLGLEITTCRLTATGPRPRVAGTGRDRVRGAPRAALKGRRPAFFPRERRFAPTPVFDRDLIRSGDRFDGPAIFEGRDSTVVVPPRARATVDRFLNLRVALGGRRKR
jgi:N-methylhydantoinase A/oxoprolinase/acetone carboxylase beta subunit